MTVGSRYLRDALVGWVELVNHRVVSRSVAVDFLNTLLDGRKLSKHNDHLIEMYTREKAKS